MDKRSWTYYRNLFLALIEFKRQPVAVKLLRTKEDFEKSSGREFDGAINYCMMVRSASSGNILKAQSKNFRCRSGCRVMGVDKSDPLNSQGENWARLGLYKDAELSKEIRGSLSYLQEDVYGILIGSIEEFDNIPDVVLIIDVPGNIMRVVQGYSYAYGISPNIATVANQAICYESTTRPYVTKDINLSLLCTGTRHQTRWSESEMSMGISIEKFEGIVEGILHTVNPMENNERKEWIKKNLESLNIDYEIKFDYNYYMET